MREHSSLLQAYREANIQHDAIDFPVYSLTLGSRDPNAPTLLLTGGIHGIERIGSQVLIAWLETLLERLQWDTGLQQQLQQLQLVVMPIMNPVGMFLNQSANGNGVDLNRNAPIDAEGRVPLLGGGARRVALRSTCVREGRVWRLPSRCC
jgi:predicted deacylase